MVIRLVNNYDLDDLFEWRNDSLTRLMSLNSKKISKKEHEIWFRDLLLNEDSVTIIGLNEDQKIGVCRFFFDKKNNVSEVSINLNPQMRGKNMSLFFLEMAIKNYMNQRACDLMATIKNNNFASKKIFEKCGFQLAKQYKNYGIYKLNSVK